VTGDRERAQFVVLAAAVVAVALAPVVLSYLQLGYHADARAAAEYDDPVGNAERFLERAVHDSAADIPGEYEWRDRRAAVDVVQDRLDGHRETLATSRVEEGVVYATGYNLSVADDRQRRNCPGGPDRDFGRCESRRGIVIQERDDDTHVLAVALDVTVTTPRGEHEVTVVVRTVGGV